MTVSDRGANHAALMDGVYRWQRHVYDLTRKYYLLGRDRMIAGLGVPAGGTVLEIGCGTGRNIVLAAERFPQARFFGLDISSEMLATARAKLGQHDRARKATLALGDATDFDAAALFGVAAFDRVFLSYAISMIPDWEAAIAGALDALAPGGSLHVVDFGQQEGLPSICRRLLGAWLAKFHVTPRATLKTALQAAAARHGATLRFETVARGYAWNAVLTVPAAP